MRGSGILCPAVKDWSEFGEEVDEFETGYDYQWILTAGTVLEIFLPARLVHALLIDVYHERD